MEGRDVERVCGGWRWVEVGGGFQYDSHVPHTHQRGVPHRSRFLALWREEFERNTHYFVQSSTWWIYGGGLGGASIIPILYSLNMHFPFTHTLLRNWRHYYASLLALISRSTLPASEAQKKHIPVCWLCVFACSRPISKVVWLRVPLLPLKDSQKAWRE